MDETGGETPKSGDAARTGRLGRAEFSRLSKIIGSLQEGPGEQERDLNRQAEAAPPVASPNTGEIVPIVDSRGGETAIPATDARQPSEPSGDIDTVARAVLGENYIEPRPPARDPGPQDQQR